MYAYTLSLYPLNSCVFATPYFLWQASGFRSLKKNKEAVDVSIATEVLGGVLLDAIQSLLYVQCNGTKGLYLKPWRNVSHCGVTHCFKVISDSYHLRHDHARTYWLDTVNINF
jgi:hypothetical protein